MGKKRKLASAHIDFEEENEELQDDVDKFHAADRKLEANAYKKKKARTAEEILNVEADESGEDVPSESDFDDDSGEEPLGVVGNEWGRKRKDFYGTEYVDEDWGGMREEELEDAELEEEDAADRQAALDKAAALASDLFEKEDQAEGKTTTVVKETNFEWKLLPVKKLNRRTAEIIEEYNRRKDLMNVIVDPLVAVIRKLPQMSNVRKQILLVHDVYTTYILTMMFYLQLKEQSFAKKDATDEMLESHPVLERIDKFAKMIKHVDAFLDKNASALKRLLKKASSGEQIESAIVEPHLQKHAEQELSEETRKTNVLDGDNHDVADDESMSVEDRRRANKQIEKNFKADSGTRHKKTPKTARTKNRKRYKEAVKKVRSQIGTIRTEMQKYTGESRGIRVSTVKSTKLSA
ncbi:unnamed protein product [Cylicocyclus nassatus]|uniref:Sas10 C-terminal domain-containing protein n=1 Tax=Cylicocyclus nassatus TaxID=53992 RepID=A0AA36MBV5_CYLNA|nr:unnamed protein product [Cylicocyclus nassatus]